MIRVRVAAASAVAKAGLTALIAEQAGIEIVEDGDADVTVVDGVAADGAIPHVVLVDGSTAEALRSGARAVLPRNATAAQIAAAIYAAAAGLVTVPAEDVGAVISHEPGIQSSEPLTARETEVLEMLAEGLSNKEIAYRLSISEHTAKFHVNSILAKLHAGTRTEAVTRGIRQGLIMI